MKKTPLHPEHARSIARWEDEGGAGQPPSEAERDAETARGANERLRIRKARRRRAK